MTRLLLHANDLDQHLLESMASATFTAATVSSVTQPFIYCLARINSFCDQQRPAIHV
jgi:hypothetical protein